MLDNGHSFIYYYFQFVLSEKHAPSMIWVALAGIAFVIFYLYSCGKFFAKKKNSAKSESELNSTCSFQAAISYFNYFAVMVMIAPIASIIIHS